MASTGRRYSIHLVALIMALAVQLLAARAAQAEPAKKTVRVLYLVPSDRHEREDYKNAIIDTMCEIQLWYACNLNGKTFRLNDPMIEVREVDHPAAWYNDHQPAGDVTDRNFYTWYNALQAASEAFGAKTDDPDYVWMIFIDAPGGTGAGTTGVAVLTGGDLKGLVRKQNIGGSAHELGHALGLPHPGDEFADALMQTGYINYPKCYLTKKDKQTLLKSDFIADDVDVDPQGRYCFIYEGGYFRWISGWRFFEYKTETGQVLNFKLRREDDDFYYIARPEGDGFIWVALPKKDHGTQVWWAGQDGDYTEAFVIRK